MIATIILSFTIQNYCDIIYCFSCAVLNPVTYLFCNGKLQILISLLFHSSSQPSPLLQLVVCSLYPWVSSVLSCLFVSFIFKIPKISEIIWYSSFSFWLILLSIILSRSVYVVTNGKVSFFFLWLNDIPSHVYICIYIPHLFYPLIYIWTLRLLPYLGCSGQCCNKHRDTYIFSNLYFCFLENTHK